jgi:hypothetical protein
MPKHNFRFVLYVLIENNSVVSLAQQFSQGCFTHLNRFASQVAAVKLD